MGDSHDSQGVLAGPSPWRGYLILFVCALGLYAATANRGEQWVDSGWQIWRIVSGQLDHPRGLALCHPLHYWLGRMVVRMDLVEPCHAITLLSALFGAVAVANVYGCSLTLTRHHGAALLAAGSLGLANTVWQLSTRTETYTLTLALLSAECWSLALFVHTRRPRWIYAAMAFNGLGVANHMLAALTTPVLVVFMVYAVRRRDIRRSAVVLGLIIWMVATLPYSGLVAAEMVRTADVGETLRSALFGESYMKQVLNVGISARMVVITLAFVVLNFPNLLLPAAVTGIARARRSGVPRSLHRVLLAYLVMHAGFALRFDVADRQTFLVPSYLLLALFSAIGFAGWMGPTAMRRRTLLAWGALTLLALTPVVYAVTPAVARRFKVLESVARHKPYRDDYTYLFTPWSVAERSAERMSRRAVALAGHDGVIFVEDVMARFAVSYRAMREGLHADQIVQPLTPRRIHEAVQRGRLIVLVPQDADRPPPAPPFTRWERVEDLYRLTGGGADE